MKNRGFTLLEVMLALALASLVLIAVAIAIDVNLRLLDSGRTHVEEAQLARALLRRIADDLRNAIYYDPVDVQKLMANMMPQVAAAGDTLDDVYGELQEKAGDAGIKIEDLETTTPSESAEPPPVPGLYGNRYELQVDTSRLPRIDQFDGMVTADDDASVADLVSDVKTVAYFVVDAQQGATAYASSASQNGSGLFRRELDRAISSYAADNGLLGNVERDMEPIAPEVAAIEFMYYDGTEWVYEWDSDERGGLPLAIEISIALFPLDQNGNSSTTTSSSRRTTSRTTLADQQELLFYRLLVHLPVAQPTEEDALAETEETPEEPEEPEENEPPQ